ncbi:Hypothetical protein Tpal_235 [Trichococcus palustris]|uniref:Uncharacterized protein n=1 Tax=Trichococcus palustris TaxID=140314 RepID=A0A143Y7J3_9LACT|nr:hypothetical protein [Trichococcus palustris]CZQ81736.1 Hypothetical protein Tpal_235 [Trichococcus palustris]SFK61893.1 hypothetical protein SAMN04488076_10255 [Trichococcus palustris]
MNNQTSGIEEKENLKEKNAEKENNRTNIVSAVTGPLKMIAVFATSSEVIGTLVVPFINDSRNQLVLISFLIVYPAFLTSLFFFVLYNKNHVLYGPSDFSNQNDFLKLTLKTKEIAKFAKQTLSSEKNDEDKIRYLGKAIDDIEKLQDKYKGYK